MKFSAGPLPTNFGGESLLSFYREIACSEDIVRAYAGEAYCPKRPADSKLFGKIRQIIEEAGKELVFSTLSLPTSESHFESSRKLIEEADAVEVNNLGFLPWLKNNYPQKKLIMGSTCNLYNGEDLAVVRDWGAAEAAIHFDILPAHVKELLSSSPLPLEVPLYGRFPLAFSWRCYTAHLFGRNMDNCGLACFGKKELVLQNLEGRAAFVVNGPLVQPGKTVALIGEALEYSRLNAAFGRFYLLPGEGGMVMPLYRSFLSGRIDGKELEARLAEMKGGEVTFGPIAGRAMVC